MFIVRTDMSIGVGSVLWDPSWTLLDISMALFQIYLYKKIDFKWNKAEPFFKYSVKKKSKKTLG